MRRDVCNRRVDAGVRHVGERRDEQPVRDGIGDVRRMLEKRVR